MSVMQPCTDCNGTGKVPRTESYAQGPSGSTPHFKDCSTCKGQGKVLAPPDVGPGSESDHFPHRAIPRPASVPDTSPDRLFGRPPVKTGEAALSFEDRRRRDPPTD